MQPDPETQSGAEDETATAIHLHRAAMELSYQALNAYSSGLGKVSQELFKLALKNELAAMAVCPDEGLPSRAVLRRSAAFLAHQAGADEQAADLARHCLAGNLPKYLIQQLFDIVSSYQEPYSPVLAWDIFARHALSQDAALGSDWFAPLGLKRRGLHVLLALFFSPNGAFCLEPGAAP